MKAAVMHEFGPPEVLRYEDVPDPVVGRGEVLLRVRSVSVNRTHCLRVRSGEYFPGLPFPHVLGVDPAGTVEAVGDGVHVWKRGDRVVVHHAIACGACEACRAGEGEYCDRQRQIGIHRWG
ncbi:MAG: alcohol dehydrogenase, partial [Chloroflexi bacterium]